METYIVKFEHTPSGSYEREDIIEVTVKSHGGKYGKRATDYVIQRYNKVKIKSCRLKG